MMMTPMLQTTSSSYIVDEKDAQRGIVAGGKQHLDDGDDEKSVVLHSRRQGERAQTRADAHAQQFSDQPCGRDTQQKFQRPCCNGLEEKETLLSVSFPESTMYFMMLWKTRQG